MTRRRAARSKPRCPVGLPTRCFGRKLVYVRSAHPGHASRTSAPRNRSGSSPWASALRMSATNLLTPRSIPPSCLPVQWVGTPAAGVRVTSAGGCAAMLGIGDRSHRCRHALSDFGSRVGAARFGQAASGAAILSVCRPLNWANTVTWPVWLVAHRVRIEVIGDSVILQFVNVWPQDMLNRLLSGVALPQFGWVALPRT